MELSKNAFDLGFIDSPPSVELIPVIERYQGKEVKSIYMAALEVALGKKATISPGRWVEFGKKKVEMDQHCFARVKLPEADALAAYSMIDLVNHRIPAEKLVDRVVILGYDGALMEKSKTAMGMVKGHRIFCYQLFALLNDLRPD